MLPAFSSTSSRGSSRSSNDNDNIDIEQGNLFASTLGDNNNEVQLPHTATSAGGTPDDVGRLEDGADEEANMEEGRSAISQNSSGIAGASSVGAAEAEGTVASGYAAALEPSATTSEGLQTNIPHAMPEIIDDGEDEALPAAAVSSTMATGARQGLQLIDDNEGPAPPLPLMDTVVDDDNEPCGIRKTRSQRVEQINDNDGSGEVHPYENSGGTEEYSSKKLASSLNEQYAGLVPPTTTVPPAPSNLANLEDEVEDKKPRAVRPYPDEDSIIHPTREDIEDGSIQPYISPRARNYLGRNDQMTNQDENDGFIQAEDEDEFVDARSEAEDEDDLERQQSEYIVPQAVAVSGELIEATPLEPQQPQQPWWKQRKARLLIGGFCVALIVLAVALGIALSTEATSPAVVLNPIVAQPSVSPSFSVSPSARMTNAPSSSLIPSSSPTTCGEGIIASSQKIDLQLLNPSNPKVAVDGENMVIVAKDSQFTRYVNVMFYNLKDNGWEMLPVSIDPEEYTSGSYSISISSKTAFIGLPNARDGAGEVLVYEKSRMGVWERSLDQIVSMGSSSGFGSFVGIDGDLACIGDHDGVSIFHRHWSNDFHLPQDKWSHLKRIGISKASGCSVAGDRVVFQSGEGDLLLYRYQQQHPFGIVPLQDPIPAKVTSVALSTDYLVYSDDTSTTIYHQEGINQTFVLSQRLNSSISTGKNQISMDGDILVIGGSNHTSIPTEHNGYWNESIVLDRSFDRYELTGRDLIATLENEVYYMNLENCVQSTPTQMPTSSVIPTSSPCYGIEIAVVYDGYPSETSWELQAIDELGNVDVIATHKAAYGDDFHTESMCLPEGEYNFTIYDSYGDGIFSPGHYNITSSNGGLIAEGGEFGYDETTFFVLPFSPAPSSTPSFSPTSPLSLYPSSSLFPSISPSSSSRPSMTAMQTRLFGHGGHSSELRNVAIHGDTAVVTSETDIHFFSFVDGSFDLVTKIDIGYEGWDIAMNDNTVVVGSDWENDWTGAIYIYEKDGNGVWKETMKIVPNDIRQGAWFGWSVAIDGNVIVVGAFGDGENMEGSVYVYRQDEGNWVEEAKLTPPDDSKAEDFGDSVSVRNNKIVVGDAYYKRDAWYDYPKGAAFEYEFDSLTKSWNLVGGILTNEDCSGYFGYDVKFTDDEELLVLCDDDNTLYYYEKQEEEFIVKQSIVFDGRVYRGDIAVDGDAMVVNENRSGRSDVIRFFVRTNHVWEEVNRINDDGLEPSFGEGDVALFENTTLIGSNYNVYVVEDYFSTSYANPTTTISSPPQSPTPSGAPSSVRSYYPNWMTGHCDNDSEESTIMVGVKFYETVEECCQNEFSFQLEDCLTKSP